MTRFLTICALVLIVSSAHSQTSGVTGRVLDAATLEPLPFANVFINHTTLGAAADEKGYFKLSGLPPGEVEVVFSFVGYQSYQTKQTLEPYKTMDMVVKLVQDKELLDVVNVQGKRDKQWEDQLKKFTKTFIGDAIGSLHCTITNPWVLEFREGTVGEVSVLFAEALAPLRIENLSLGYSITYHLTRFTSNAQSYLIQGSVRFEEMITSDTELLSRWQQNRLHAYHGSYRHLFYSVLNHRLKEEGFRLYTVKAEAKIADNVVRSTFTRESANTGNEINSSEIEIIPGKKQGVFELSWKTKSFLVQYQGKQSSAIDLKNGTITVNANGIVLDPQNLTLSGDLSQARVSQLLPDNFIFTQKTSAIAPLQAMALSSMENLREGVYVSTDKPYYYPGEMIWLNSFMTYSNPQKRDTLSRLLHVELINLEKRVIRSDVYVIENGVAAGNIFLPDSLAPGSYFIRAYTRWMRNFGDETAYIKPFTICPLTQKVESEPYLVEDRAQAIIVKINPDREVYTTREKVSVAIELSKEGVSAPGVFSVSVIDAKQVAEIQTPSIRSVSLIQRKSVLENSPILFDIEYGVSLRGKVINTKERGRKNIVIVQGKNEDMTSVETDEQGKFRISGFQFYDSAEFSFQVKDRRKKIGGKVVLENESLPVTTLPIPQKLKIEEKSILQRAKTDYQLPTDSKLLEDVTIRSNRLDNGERVKKYSQPDYTMRGDWIVKQQFGSLIQAIKHEVPSTRIIPFLEDNIMKFTITFDLAVSNTEPLLLIDGQPYFSPDGIYSRLMQFNMSSVDHIDVLKFSGGMDYGVRSNGGIIAIYTKTNDSNGPANTFDQRYFHSLKIKGYTSSGTFPFRDYSKAEEDTNVDFRSTLHWEPSKMSDDQGKANFTFYAADLPTRYKIVIEGLTILGEPFYSERLIEVKLR